jgi:hypothetical protein
VSDDDSGADDPEIVEKGFEIIRVGVGVVQRQGRFAMAADVIADDSIAPGNDFHLALPYPAIPPKSVDENDRTAGTGFFIVETRIVDLSIV